jgi:putative ABC transport system permease protein
MALPLKYNLRNLRVRWHTTLATVVGIGLVVWVFLVVMALARGLKSTFIETGDKRNIMVLRKGSTAESSSQITRNEVRRIRYLDGIARDSAGEPLSSAEILVLITLDRRDRTGTANVLVRGLGPVGLTLRTTVKLAEGRMFQPGNRECIVSRKVANRFAGCRIGEQFRTGKTMWTVVGIFDAARTAFESEVWTDADEARDVFKRDFYGSILIRPVDEDAIPALTQRMENDKELSVRVLREQEYYEEQTKTSTAPIQIFGTFLAVIMSIGAAFAAMNTMYAAVGARTREIGTLRVLGFRRREIYVSFLLESILLSGLGGLLGCGAALFWNGVSTGTMSFTTFSEIAFEFRVTWDLLLEGLAFAIIMGVVGGLLPAKLAAQKPVLDALRSV